MNNSQPLLFGTIAKQLFGNIQDKTITIKKNKNDITSPQGQPKKFEDIKMTAAGDIKNDVLALGLQASKAIDPKKYKSDALLEPKSEADRQKYFIIYTEYASQSLTQKQLAEKHGYSPTHMSRIIKWAAHQIGNIDNDSELKIMVDFNKHRLQEIAGVKASINKQMKELDEQKDDLKDNDKSKAERAKIKVNLVTNLAKCWKAEHQINRLVSQITGLMSGAVIQVNDHRSVNYQIAPSFERKTGSEMLPEDDIKTISPTAAEGDITDGSGNDINSAPITNIDRNKNKEDAHV